MALVLRTKDQPGLNFLKQIFAQSYYCFTGVQHCEAFLSSLGADTVTYTEDMVRPAVLVMFRRAKFYNKVFTPIGEDQVTKLIIIICSAILCSGEVHPAGHCGLPARARLLRRAPAPPAPGPPGEDNNTTSGVMILYPAGPPGARRQPRHGGPPPEAAQDARQGHTPANTIKKQKVEENLLFHF